MPTDVRRQSQEALQTLLELYDRLESSLLRYLREATPWATPRHQPLVVRLHRQADEQDHSLQIMADVVLRHHLRPPSQVWPDEFTTLHYLSLAYVMDRLVADQRAIADTTNSLVALWRDERTTGALQAVHSQESERFEELCRIRQELRDPSA